MVGVHLGGTSAGIGYDAGLFLAPAGHEVVATMRNPVAGNLHDVTAEGKLGVTVLPLDADYDELVVEVFGKVGGSLDVFVNDTRIYGIIAVEDEGLRDEDYIERAFTGTGADLRVAWWSRLATSDSPPNACCELAQFRRGDSGVATTIRYQ